MVFIIVIVGLFMVNREIITRNIQNTGFLDRILNRSAQPANTEDLPELVEIPPEDIPHVVIENPPIEEPPPVDIRPENPPEEISDPVTPPVAATPPPVQTPPQEKRDRSLYFMKLDNDGTIVRTQVSRALPVSNSPMMDVLSVLIQGPNADERKKGLESLIPEGTEILSATVRGSTAYISFSENFQFNTYGVEGYAAQLRQIVWTVTEFPNINDVQILLEGRRIDYLGEGIWIGSPLSREML
jgi:hypothetical protein